MQFSVISRRHYADLVATPPSALTDILRACRFLYLKRLGYSGLVKSNHYMHKTRKPPALRAHTLPPLIRDIHARFNGVQIECLSYEEILDRFDHPDAFLYLDPPYYGLEFYKFNFTEQDFQTLAKRLKELRGRFLLSLNDVPEVRQIFSSFHIEQVVNYCASKRVPKRPTGELLISNYQQPCGNP
jgi:DNA adenine methylase